MVQEPDNQALESLLAALVPVRQPIGILHLELA